ncbi:MAG: outer membrane beta-barrel protein [Bacteroidales bacterium]|nr:outer membrane beta-barrel protein [Bacteroidales bacterium]
MNKKFTTLLMIVILALCPMTFFGQNEIEKQATSFNDYAYVSGDLGLGLLNGDNSGVKLGLNGNLGIGYQFDHIVGIKGNIGFGGLNGKYDHVSIDKSNYFNANLNLTVSFTDIILGYNPDRKFNAVPHIGFGQVRYQIRLEKNNGNIYENGYSERYGRKVAATIPMGFELNYAINPNWKVYLDYTATYADTDLLDGVARGKHNDWFSSVNLGASYRLGSEANIFRRNDPYCNYWYLMADGGASFLFGDNQYNFKSVRGNANVGIGYDFHNFYRIYGKLGYGIFTGEYENFFTLDYADYYTANINIAAEIVGFIFGYDQDRRYGVYPHVGLGQMQYRARATYANGKKTSVGYDHNASYNKKGRGFYDRKVVMTVPVGIELNYIINQRVDVYADVTTEWADSDIVDAIWSGTHNDWHTTINAGLRYKLNGSCYKVEEETNNCITPEDVKNAIKEALQEYEANRPQTEAAATVRTEVVEKRTVYHTNHANIVFPINEVTKAKTQTNIDAINRASQEVQNGFHVESILVEGYASPEGPADKNYRLAEERAKAAAELVQEELHTHLEPSQVTIHSNGGDWDGLFEAILGSDLANKEAIVKEIQESSNREEILRKLMNKYSGIEPLLPQLRRANVTITTIKD